MSKKIKRIIFYIVVLILTIIVVKNINNNRIIYIDNFRKSIDKIILL